MTDQPTSYRSHDARTLTIDAARGWGKPDHVHLSIEPEPTALIGAAPFSMFIPTARLLAMIDTEDPDAMRAYLRERSDLIDAPDESCSTLEDMLPADLAAEAARYRAADVPEADSSEDVDERPAPATTERLALLGQIRDLYPNLPPSRHIGVVHWLLEGTVLIERVERLLDRSAR